MEPGKSRQSKVQLLGRDVAMSETDARAEFQRLQALRESGLLTAPAFPGLNEICQQAKAHFKVAMALVTLIDKDLQIIKARVGTTLEQTPRSDAFCDYTIRADDVFVVPDATKDPRFAANPLVTGEPYLRFYAGAPLIYLRDIRLGALCLLDPKPREFSLGDRAELAEMSDEAVSIIMRQVLDRRSAAAGL
jgi:GAF domain-containing protein